MRRIDYNSIPELLAEGKTREQIAEHFGTTLNSLQAQCSERGISLRSPDPEMNYHRYPPLRVRLRTETRTALQERAAIIELTEDRLITKLLEAVVRDDLILAILDKDAYRRRAGVA